MGQRLFPREGQDQGGRILIGCRLRRISRPPGVLPSSSSSSTRATWRPASIPIPCVDLTAEAIGSPPGPCLMPDDGEVAKLLALMVLPRRAAPPGFGERRTGPPRRADRGAWDAALIAEGHRLVRERLAAGVAPGRYRSSLRSTPCTPPPARTRHRLVAGRRPLRPARPPRPLADHRPQPGHRGRRARRPGGGTGGRRPSRGQAGRLSRLPRDPRRPAAPAGLQPEVARRVRQSHRAGVGNTAETAYLTRRRDQLG